MVDTQARQVALFSENAVFWWFVGHVILVGNAPVVARGDELGHGVLDTGSVQVLGHGRGVLKGAAVELRSAPPETDLLHPRGSGSQ